MGGRLHWELTNYTVLWFAAIGIVFGGWWFLSAKNWFKGPVRQGTEEELERGKRSSRARRAHAGSRRGSRRALARSESDRGARRARAPLSHTQAPPFWSIVWPVTPRESGDSSHATVPATSAGSLIRRSGTSRIASR